MDGSPNSHHRDEHLTHLALAAILTTTPARSFAYPIIIPDILATVPFHVVDVVSLAVVVLLLLDIANRPSILSTTLHPTLLPIDPCHRSCDCALPLSMRALEPISARWIPALRLPLQPIREPGCG